MLINQKQLSTFLETWIDTPYLHRQRQPKRGVDCLNLLIAFLQHAGKDVDTDVAYCTTPTVGILYDILHHDLKLKQLRELPEYLEFGDVLTIYRLGGIPYHVAIYIGNNTCVECNDTRVHVRTLSKPFKRRVASVWRLDD